MIPITASVFRHYWDWIILCFLLVIGWRWPQFGDRLIAPIEKFFSRFASRKTVAIVSVALFVVVLRVSLLPFFPVRPPAVHDEYSYLLAADTFAHGRLANPPHPMWIYFDTFEELQHPTYSSMLPPAQGGFLALGQLLGEPWIGVLISMGCMFGALLWMLQSWFPAKWALLGTILAFLQIGVFSYWMNTYWGGSVAAFGSCIVIGAAVRWLKSRSLICAFILGLGVAVLLNSRPYEGFFLLFGLTLLIGAKLIRARRTAKTNTAWILGPSLVVMLLNAGAIGYYNYKVTGNPTLLPHELSNRQYLSISPFVWASLTAPKHYSNRQFDVMYNHWARNLYHPTWSEFVRVTRNKFHDFLGFFFAPPVWLSFIAVPWVLIDRRMRAPWILFAIAAMGALAVAWFIPHYAAPIFPVVAVIAVQMIRHLRRWKFGGRPVGIGLTRTIVTCSLLAAIATGVTTLKNPGGDLPDGFGYTPSWARQNISEQLREMPGNHLVIVRYSNHHPIHQDWVFNAADIDRSKVVWAREIPGISMQPLLDYYKDRRVWLIQPDKDPWHVEPYTPLPAIVTTAESANASPSRANHGTSN